MSFKYYEDIISMRMKSARFKHSKNVAREAVRLAKKYGADEAKAELAGILHDATKETDGPEQMSLIRRAGIVLTEMEQNSSKLWHAISGSAYVQVELDITDKDIIGAIRYHTTGRAGMSVLEKVIFVADFTSADRDYEGVDRIRRIADKSLDEAVLEGMAFTISDLAQRKITIAPDTFAGYNEMAALRAKARNREK
ncbi:MAG: bis(5'-nucleosyl)-tetraphosphatase (symmetrical) YqeK [Clostridia bacterium]|nr:bis(5'-nucleosyl)-tetraphosphatase (symmetrical) YqeK [Clostridia bacterium]